MQRSIDTTVVSIRGLGKSFGPTRVLKDIDLDVHRGEVVAIIGPSGSGKTTLLRCVNALETYEEGSIRLDGVEVAYIEDPNGRRRLRKERELSAIRAETGMVFQMFYLFPHLTAAENVMLGLRKVRGKAKVEARAVAERWLSRVGLADKFDSYPAQHISGKEQLELDCDVLAPCAVENQITSENVDRIRARLIVEGANGPTTAVADEKLEQRGIVVVPDILANAGGVTVSYFEWVQDRMGYFWTEDVVNSRLEQTMVTSFEEVHQTAKKHGVSLRKGAYILALDRVVTVYRTRGLFA